MLKIELVECRWWMRASSPMDAKTLGYKLLRLSIKRRNPRTLSILLECV